jgi:hypothetical protein
MIQMFALQVDWQKVEDAWETFKADNLAWGWFVTLALLLVFFMGLSLLQWLKLWRLEREAHRAQRWLFRKRR